MAKARPDAVFLLLRAAATGPRRQTIGALAARAGLSYGVARRAADEAARQGWLVLCETDIRGRQHLHWELTEAGGRQLAAALSGRAG